MGFTLTSADYVSFIESVARRIHDNGEYISGLDAATGDGDHWANMNLGFESLVAAGDELKALPIDGAFRKIGMLMMSKIGGSSGILYGSAYVAASKVCAGRAELDASGLCAALEAMVNDMMARGKAEPGMKTMIDSLYPAVQAFKRGLEAGDDEKAYFRRSSRLPWRARRPPEAWRPSRAAPAIRPTRAWGTWTPARSPSAGRSRACATR